MGIGFIFSHPILTITVFMLNSSIDCDQIPIITSVLRNLIHDLIVIFTSFDICKWRVARLWHEKLTRSRAPVHICFPLCNRVNLQCLFCPFWNFNPNLLGMKVLYQSKWCHIFVGDTIYFVFLYLNMVWCQICWLTWQGMFFNLARESSAPSWCSALFCFAFIVHIIGSSCMGGMCCLSFSIYCMLCVVEIVTYFGGTWIIAWRLSVWHLIHWRPLIWLNLYMLSIVLCSKSWLGI